MRTLVVYFSRTGHTQTLAQLSPADYDLVVLGTPIWMFNLSSPMRSYIRQTQGHFRKLALFCTCDGAGQSKVLADMQALCDKVPVATPGLTSSELHDRFHQERRDRFLEQIKQVERNEAPAPLRPRPAF
jgi:flavodoxin